MSQVLVGADPELFVSRNGTISSAIGLVGGSKLEPLHVELGALQEDNVLLEFNIDPASSLEEFQHHVKHVMQQGADSLSRFELTVAAGLSSHVYGEGELESFGESAFIFGCEPDWNAWTNEENVFPTGVNPHLRTAGGHIHIGYDHITDPSMELNCNIAKMCDYLMGLPSILMDKDDCRRELYGKAGAIRHKPYGVEYRTLSNFWLFSDELMAWAYNNAVAAFERVDELALFESIVSGEEVARIINTNDKDAAKAACDALGVVYA